MSDLPANHNGTSRDPQDPGRGAPEAALSPSDREALAELEAKFQLVRDRTTAVARGYQTGFYLHGDGGVGKSYTVLTELKRLQAYAMMFNSRMTGRGLYNELEMFPDAIHVMEDMEQITRDRGAQGVLRSALWGQRREGDRGPMERLVTWTTYKMKHSFIFTGGIIMIGNRPLGDLPELNSVKTRIAVMHMQASDPELRALMRAVSLRGFEADGKQLQPAECVEVCEHIVEQSFLLHRQLDMRVLINSYQDRLQWDANDAGCHWRDLVAARLRERPTAFREQVVIGGRRSRKEQEQEIAREIARTTTDRAERLRIWRQRTGKSQQSLYRRLQEVREE
jgi:hypothetical protein